MISRRANRSTSPQENLRQFAVNVSKGIDLTKPATDLDVAADLENLTINLDGSVSLRKRLTPAYRNMIANKFTLFTGDCVFSGDQTNGFAIYKRTGGDERKLRFLGTNYYTYEEVLLDWDFSNEYFNLLNATFLNTATSTIIGNSTCSLYHMCNSGLADPELYDSHTDTMLPRYLSIVKSSEEGYDFDVRVISPELNLINAAQGEIPLNPNMCLDSPYATRDSYGNAVPAILGFIPYLNTSDDYHIYHIQDDVVERSMTFESDGTVKSEGEYTTNFKKSAIRQKSEGFGEILDGPIAEDISVQVRVYEDNGYAYLDIVYDNANSSFLQGFPKIEMYLRVCDGAEGASPVFKSFETEAYTPDGIDENSTFMSQNLKIYPKFEVKYLRNLKRIPIVLKCQKYSLKYSHHTFKNGSDELVLYVLGTDSSGEYDYVGQMTDKHGTSDVRLTREISGSKYIVDVWSETMRNWVVYAILYIDQYGKPTKLDDDYNIWECTEYSMGVTEPQTWQYNAANLVGDSEWLVVEQLTMHWTTLEYTVSDAVRDTRVSDISENCHVDVKTFKPISKLGLSEDLDRVWLKAFCRLPKSKNVFYATWDYSLDGVSWNTYGNLQFKEYAGASVKVKVMDEQYAESDTAPVFTERVYVPLNASGRSDDRLIDFDNNVFRIDVLPLATLNLYFESRNIPVTNLQLRFTIATLTHTEDAYEQLAIVSSSTFFIPSAPHTEFLKTDLPNAVLGEKLYYKKSIVSYGTPEYSAFVYCSDSDSFITPLYNIIDLDVNSSDIVCSVVPWRDYLMCLTEHAIYLSSKQDVGFTTKTVTTSAGVPYVDRFCVQQSLNGVLFKSGTSVYFAYPNLYSGTDSFMNLTEVSKPVAHIFESLTNSDSNRPPYAEIIEDKYVLMQASEDCTHCVVYDLSTKLWEKYTYQVPFSLMLKDPYGVVTVVGDLNYEYTLFEEDLSKTLPRVYVELPKQYCDVLGPGKPSPIEFLYDSGQKTDAILTTKQFVESKLIFATEDDAEEFPMRLVVAIDGDPHVITTDVSTDAPFWKDATSSVGVANTVFRLSNDDCIGRSDSGIFRQLAVRYSGKGRSIRHVLIGTPTSNFKLYESYIRYKNSKK